MHRLVVLLLLAGSCHSCRHDDDDDDDEEEEADDRRPNYWRAQIEIVGEGNVASTVPAFDCTRDSTAATGRCGPTLVTFDEMHPPLLDATAAPGWTFSRWDSRTFGRDGRVTRREGPMPDGRFYLNGFGYSDTGALETVTAIFVLAK